MDAHARGRDKLACNDDAAHPRAWPLRPPLSAYSDQPFGNFRRGPERERQVPWAMQREGGRGC